ncbi:MAG: glycosyltransferase family 2 protein [Bacteroidetes bacterium]|nr:glycosyltransferase family 2 protein [Bacteroidota bacterium]MBS1973559.1 glycosyltransferase family 2 protein [Bacteroidota bacterium]
MTDLSIVIVNYKSADLIINCLSSVYASTTKIDFEIIVVDNDSKDNSKETILSAFPGIRWIDMNYNSGFARANNKGIQSSNADTLLLLNADTLIQNNAIENCYGLFSNSEYVACGGQLLNPDLSPQISGNYFIKGGLNCLLPLPYLGKFLKWAGTLLNVKKPNVPNADSTVEVDWINGAFLMVKKAAIKTAGLMDEDFFLYSEEAEWCSRLQHEGRLCIFGACKVIHLQGETATEAFGSSDKAYSNLFDRKGLQIMLSNLVRIRKQFGSGWFLAILFFHVIEVPVFAIGLILSKIFLNNKKKGYTFRQLKGYCSNLFFLLKKTFIIVRNKPYFYKVL